MDGGTDGWTDGRTPEDIMPPVMTITGAKELKLQLRHVLNQMGPIVPSKSYSNGSKFSICQELFSSVDYDTFVALLFTAAGWCMYGLCHKHK